MCKYISEFVCDENTSPYFGWYFTPQLNTEIHPMVAEIIMHSKYTDIRAYPADDDHLLQTIFKWQVDKSIALNLAQCSVHSNVGDVCRSLFDIFDGKDGFAYGYIVYISEVIGVILIHMCDIVQ
jgi:hypothetical protein